MKFSWIFALACALGSAWSANYTATQVRLAFSGHDGILISWNTADQNDKPTIRYGESQSSLTNIATGSPGQIFQSAVNYANTVSIGGLQADTTYYYTIDGDANQNVRTFKTSVDGGTKEFVYGFVGDMGLMGSMGLSDKAGAKVDSFEILKPGEQNTMESLKRQVDDLDFIIHGGDFAYADYWLKEEMQHYINGTLEDGPRLYIEMVDMFYDELEPLTSKLPYMAVPGNHDAACDNGGYKNVTGISICPEGQRDFIPYNNHWKMPSNISGGVESMWYSFDYGPVHFVVIDTETDLGNGLVGPDQTKDGIDSKSFGSYENEQVDWLEKDLKAVNRCKTPWVIVTGHRPWYVSHVDYECKECREAFEKILVDNHVDLVHTGHVHNYQRWLPVAYNESDPNGYNNPKYPVYIGNGAGGHYDGLDLIDSTISDESLVPKRFDNAYGWSRVTVHNNTHLTQEFISSSNDSVLDSVTLYKEHLYMDLSFLNN